MNIDHLRPSMGERAALLVLGRAPRQRSCEHVSAGYVVVPQGAADLVAAYAERVLREAGPATLRDVSTRARA